VSSNNTRGPIVMGELKPRVMNLLINALQFESDSHNSQMLLGKYNANILFLNDFHSYYFIYF